MVHYSYCPLCSSIKTDLYLQTNDFFFSSEPFSLLRCSDCGFIFTQDHPDEKEIGKYYESETYISHNDSARGITNILYRFSRGIMLGIKRRIAGKATGMKSGRLLDIGSGTGHFIYEMKKAGWSVNGIEINEKARQYSISTLGVDVISPEKISSLPDGTIDCITLWHVLEHFQDPFGYAAEIKRLLKPGGVCIIALPNSSSFDAAYYGKFWAAYDVPRHLWHFSPATFQVFAGKAGFSIMGIKTLPPDVFYISMLSEKYKGTRLHFPAGIITGKLFWFRSLFRKKKSSSLIYILKKKEN